MASQTVETPVAGRPLPIGAESVETGDWIDVRSPYSGALVGRVARAGAAETRRAIDAAERALRDPLPAHRRAAILDEVARLLGERHEEVARTVSDEAGKPIKAARIEVSRAISTYTTAGAVARTLVGEVVPMDATQAGEGKLALTLRRPLGVVGAITPFNFPCNLVAHKLAPALAAGCAVVLKPASATPLTALLLAEIERDAGLPAGWLNVVVGPASEIGDILVEDERIRMITFTGSGEVGWGLARRAARKRVKLELGNSTPVIVAADADVDAAAAKVAASGFAFAGQACISVQRVYVERPVYDAFLDAFVPQVEALVVGDPAHDETDIGPVIDRESRARLLAWIAEAEEHGARVLAGGLDGDLLRPTVLVDVADELRISCEEAFGPVVVVGAIDSVAEGIERANGTRYGLQAGIFTASIEAALRAASELEFGGVTVNETPTFRADQMPYGGVKASGNTKEGPAWAVREMTDERLVVIQL